MTANLIRKRRRRSINANIRQHQLTTLNVQMESSSPDGDGAYGYFCSYMCPTVISELTETSDDSDTTAPIEATMPSETTASIESTDRSETIAPIEPLETTKPIDSTEPTSTTTNTTTTTTSTTTTTTFGLKIIKIKSLLLII